MGLRSRGRLLVKNSSSILAFYFLYVQLCSLFLPNSASTLLKDPEINDDSLEVADEKHTFYNSSHRDIKRKAKNSKNPLFAPQCNPMFGELWPSNPPGPTLILGFLENMRGVAITERLGLKIPGMISYAVETINDSKYLPENYTLQIEVHDTKGDEMLSTKYVSDMACSKISAIIGPEVNCYVEASIAEAQNIPMISYACTDSKAGGRKTFARTNPSELHILRATIETIVHFKWKKISVIYETNGFETMAETFHDLAVKRNLTINHFEAFYKSDQLSNIFATTKDGTRIYVLICHRQRVPDALTGMSLTGLMTKKKKDYFLIYVDKEPFRIEGWTAYIYKPQHLDSLQMSDRCDGLQELTAFENGFMVITNTIPLEVANIENRAREYNKKEPFCLSSDTNSVLNRHVPFLSASHLYDAVSLYAIAIRELYDEKKLQSVRTGENVDMREIARNGTAIIQKLANKTFTSILGYNVTMGMDRASEGSYSVYYFQRSPECSKLTNSKLRCSSHCLVNISDFRNNRLWTNLTLHVRDEPMCGYKGDMCFNPSKDAKLVTLIILSISVVLFSLFSILKYRHWKYEQEIVGLLWKIDKSKLKFEESDVLSQSKVSIMSGASQEGGYDRFVASERRATYRGTVCCIKYFKLESKKQELSRETMKNMRLMREIKHRNVCPFIGAYVEARELIMVTEYSNRGSLEDILENEDIKLDELFISSLVQDLLRAMCFLHQSFGPHGNLKSSNCVVTGRWVLQVTDYDVYKIRYEAFKALERKAKEPNCHEERNQYYKSCLWKAPEILRVESFTPCTKEADVYAFGVILHEIVGRKGPFSTSDINCFTDLQYIVEDLKRGHCISGALRRPNTLDLALMPYGNDSDVLSVMKAAWCEDPRSRPDFKELTNRLKKIKKEGRGNLMDHMVMILEEHSKNLEGLVKERTMAVFEEKKKTEELLHSMLPRHNYGIYGNGKSYGDYGEVKVWNIELGSEREHESKVRNQWIQKFSVAANLCRNIPVEPQSYESVTIYFSDIVGFTALASSSSPYEVVSFLDDLYREFDTTVRGFDVYKVETIGDAYMVVSGLPNHNEGRHAGEIASMALELLESSKNFKIKHKPNEKFRIRIGLHTGPVMAGVVGHTMPRYCLFGDTVNTASRMESNGEALRIHVSESCRKALDDLGGYILEERGFVEMKGKGKARTFWLLGSTEKAIKRREKTLSVCGFSGSEEVKRSPRQSGDKKSKILHRTPSSVCGENSASSYRSLSPFDLKQHYLKRLIQDKRAGSLDSTKVGPRFCPQRSPVLPQRGHGIGLDAEVWAFHSLDDIPLIQKKSKHRPILGRRLSYDGRTFSKTHTTNAPVNQISTPVNQISTPVSPVSNPANQSLTLLNQNPDPTLFGSAVNHDQPKVNFCPSTKGDSSLSELEALACNEDHSRVDFITADNSSMVLCNAENFASNHPSAASLDSKYKLPDETNESESMLDLSHVSFAAEESSAKTSKNTTIKSLFNALLKRDRGDYNNKSISEKISLTSRQRENHV